MSAHTIANIVELVFEFIAWIVFLSLVIKVKKIDGKRKSLAYSGIIFYAETIIVLYRVNKLTFYVLTPFSLSVNLLFMIVFGVYGYIGFRNINKNLEVYDKKKISAIRWNSLLSLVLAVGIFQYMCLSYIGFVGYEWKLQGDNYVSQRTNKEFIGIMPSQNDELQLADFEKRYSEKGGETSVLPLEKRKTEKKVMFCVKNFKRQHTELNAENYYVVFFINALESETKLEMFIVDNRDPEHLTISEDSYLSVVLPK